MKEINFMLPTSERISFMRQVVGIELNRVEIDHLLSLLTATTAKKVQIGFFESVCTDSMAITLIEMENAN